MNVRQFIERFATSALPRSEVRLLLSHALARDAAWLAAHDDYELAAAEEQNLRTLIARRVAGEPMAYIMGYREFYGRKFKCTPAGLIPRPETELLIDLLRNPLPSDTSVTSKILDVGTGTGCIAITLALELNGAQITACDLSRDALALACENARALGARNIELIESDWFSAIDANKKFDVIVSNPPYIPPNDPHLFRGDLRFEPWLALRDRVDGLESYRELIAGAKKHLVEGGLLIVEHGYDQGESVPALFTETGLTRIEMIRDFGGQPRVTRGHLFSAT